MYMSNSRNTLLSSCLVLMTSSYPGQHIFQWCYLCVQSRNFNALPVIAILLSRDDVRMMTMSHFNAYVCASTCVWEPRYRVTSAASASLVVAVMTSLCQSSRSNHMTQRRCRRRSVRIDCHRKRLIPPIRSEDVERRAAGALPVGARWRHTASRSCRTRAPSAAAY